MAITTKWEEGLNPEKGNSDSAAIGGKLLINREAYNKLPIDLTALDSLNLPIDKRDEILAEIKSDRHFNSLNEVINSVFINRY